MLVSMTGFGRVVSKVSFGQLVVEILSVNRKYLEIFVLLPKEFSRFEYEIRKWVGEKISRGQVTVRISLTLDSKGSFPNVAMLRALKAGWEKIAKQLGVDAGQIDLPFLLQRIPEMTESLTKELPVLRKCVEAAVEALLEMKQKEGKALEEEIGKRLKNLEKMTDAVEKLAPESAKKMRQKLMEKMKEILRPEAEERLYREAALLAEKVDITEELARLFSHFEQFKTTLRSKEGSFGRKMDFLVQEMGREINTIGAKSAEAKISHLSIEMKSELEKIREQIQNVE